MSNTSVVVPNWNGKDSLGACLDSLKNQSHKAQIIVVDNGSTDGSAEFVENNYPGVILVRHATNRGFAGGVNGGIKRAMEQGAKYVALLNNDAIADSDWLKHLANHMDKNPKTGIATSKIVSADKTHLDSTGDQYTIWGLPYPRGRNETDLNRYDKETDVFGASGGASIYRVNMLKQIGLFDEDFFAYYEDIDISFRTQLAGWKVTFVPDAIVYHEISATSSKIKDFATYHTLKNLHWLMYKNVPWAMMPKVWPRLTLAYSFIMFRALLRGQFGAVFKGIFMASILLPKKLIQRHKIQKGRKVTPQYISSIMTKDLPPNANNLRKVRQSWWRLTMRPSK